MNTYIHKATYHLGLSKIPAATGSPGSDNKLGIKIWDNTILLRADGQYVALNIEPKA